MPTLSSQYAYVTTDSGAKVEPIDVSVTLDESFAPYVQANVTVPLGAIDPTELDPRQGDRLRIHLQQDFGDLIYCNEITEDFGGSVSAITAGISPMIVATFTRRYAKPWNIFEDSLPISKVTTVYGATISTLTAAGLIAVWRLSDFLHSTGTFNPQPSTIFDGNLGVREVSEDYVSQTVTITLASDELLAQDKYGYGTDIAFGFTKLRAAIEFMLIYADVGAYGAGKLDPVGGDFILSTTYIVAKAVDNLSKNLYDDMIALAQSCGFALWCDENRTWHLQPAPTTAGSLALKDDDNITAFTRTFSRNGKWYSDVTVKYASDIDYAYDPTTPFAARKYLYLDRTESSTIENDGASSIVARTKTRGETYEIEAINNFDARPRQEISIDVTGFPVMSGIIQSVTFALPSARMSIELRDLGEI